MKNSDVYAKAIDILVEQGWIQERYYDRHGQRCLVSALAQAEGEEYLCASSLESELVPFVGGLETWNDDPARTKEDVLLLLKYAAAGELDTWKALYGNE